jgi:hypothetical protein
VFARYRFDTAGHLLGFDRPTLVIHAERDTVVPYAAGRALYDTLTGPKRFLALPSGDHNDLQPATAAAYWGAVDAFIDGLATRPAGSP